MKGIREVEGGSGGALWPKFAPESRSNAEVVQRGVVGAEFRMEKFGGVLG